MLPTTPGFRGLINRFLSDRERLLKGPYVSVSLPFPPNLHQEKAFLRLSSASPLNTLVATGTGSGKTWLARTSGNGALALHHVLVIEAGPLHESLTPLRRWERSCAAPSVAHPLTAYRFPGPSTHPPLT